MIYVISDLHGIPLDHLKRLLRQAQFSDQDTLFVLGDSIDKGSHGIDLLLWYRPELTEQYAFWESVTVVFGHTPTSYYGHPGKIIRTDSWWCIDTSDVGPTLLRLDDRKAFRIWS